MATNNGFFSTLFGGSNSGGGNAGGQQPNGQQPDGQAPAEGAQAEGQQPTGQQSNGQQPPAPESNPLDIYNKMFENDDSGDQDAPPALALGRETLDKVTSQLDFTSGIDQATLDQLQQGDLSSLPALLNKVAQQVYSMSMQHSTALTNEFVGQRSEYDSKRIAPTVKSTLTQSHLDNNLGDLSKQPAMKAQMTETAQRLAKAYPDATPEWIASQAKQYVIQSASQLLGISPEDLQQFQQKQQQQQQTAQSVNWKAYFDQAPQGSN